MRLGSPDQSVFLKAPALYFCGRDETERGRAAGASASLDGLDSRHWPGAAREQRLEAVEEAVGVVFMIFSSGWKRRSGLMK